MFFRFRFIGAATAALAAGCASTGGSGATAPHDVSATPDRLRPDVVLETRLPLAAGGDESLLASRVDLRAGDELIAYRARYRVDAGSVLDGIASGKPTSNSGGLATQTLEQRLQSTVPVPVGGPIRLDVRSRQDTRLELAGAHGTRNASAGLQWSAGPVGLSVDWQQPRATLPASNPIDCNAAGALRLPAPAAWSGASFELLQRDCRFSAPGHGIAEAGLQTRGAAWRWGPDAANALRIEIVEPRVGPQAAVPAAAVAEPDYEVGLSQRLAQFRGWQASADVAVRRVGIAADAHPGVATAWTADLELRRRLPLFDVSARWSQAQDPLWFLAAAAPENREQMSLALDFDAWLDGVLPHARPTMDVSWRRSESESGETDSSVNMRLKMTW
ncbi:MAG: hypothetical protein RQ847_08165 [Wenzhouxiangellaceae bacterium]|nr:hypothetical protein [Wenzhouxiangellaceae bacterium]